MASIGTISWSNITSSSASGSCTLSGLQTDGVIYRLYVTAGSKTAYSTTVQSSSSSSVSFSFTGLSASTKYSVTATLQYRPSNVWTWTTTTITNTSSFTTAAAFTSHDINITAGTGIDTVYGKRNTATSYSSSTSTLTISTISTTTGVNYMFDVSDDYGSPYYMKYNDSSGNYTTMKISSTSGTIGTITYDRYITFSASRYYTITVSASPSAGGTVSGGGSYVTGSSRTVTATPATGYEFVKWYNGSTTYSTDASYSFTLTSDITLYAQFAKLTYTLTANPNSTYGSITSLNGWTNVSGAAQRTYNYGAQISALPTITPKTGYSFDGWYNGSTQVYITTEVYGSYTITAKYSQISYAISRYASPDEGGTVSGPTSATYNEEVTLKATPATGYEFVRWYYGETTYATTASYTFNCTGSGTYIAEFKLITCDMSANPGTYGYISDLNGWTSGSSGSATRSYTYGDKFDSLPVITCTQTGYKFSGWLNPQGYTVTENSVVYSSYTITANYELKTCTIAANAVPSAGGTVTGGGTYTYGEECTLKATPATGYEFVKWYYGETTYSEDATYKFTVTETGTYNAQFKKIQCTLTANPGTNGHISAFNDWTEVYSGVGQRTYDYGDQIGGFPTIVADTGYNFLGWYNKDDYKETETAVVYTSHTLTAKYELKTYTIASYASPSAGGTVTGAGNYTHGSECILVAKPATGYQFVRWYYGETTYGTDTTYTIESVTGSGTYIAEFELIPCTLSANPGINGKITDFNGWSEPASGIGQREYRYGDNISSLPVITPNEGYKFLGWYNPDDFKVSETTVVYDSYTLTAKYELKTYTIAAYASPTEGGTVTGAGTYTHGEECILVATQADGYVFKRWYYGETTYATTATYKFKATESKTCIAEFKAVHECTYYNGGHGTAPAAVNFYEDELIPAATAITTTDTVEYTTNYKVTYDYNGGSGSPAYDYRGGHKDIYYLAFARWRSNVTINVSGLGEQTWVYAEGNFYGPTSDMTLTAEWTDGEKKGTEGLSVPLPTPDEREYYDFKGWEIDDKIYPAGYDYTPPDNVTATAVWDFNIKEFWWDAAEGNDDVEMFWNTSAGHGRPVSNLTAENWNRFNGVIQRVAKYQSGETWTYDEVKPGDAFTWDIYNHTWLGIDALTLHGTMPPGSGKGEPIKASYFVPIEKSANLRDALNTAIENLTK